MVWGGLTAAAIRSTPKQIADDGLTVAEPQPWQQIAPVELAGIGHFRRENCFQCHKVGKRGTAVGPDLTKVPGKRDAGWLIDHFRNPPAMVPGSTMPPITLPDRQLSALSAFLLKLTPNSADDLLSAPEPIVEGALVYERFNCGVCHQVNGAGMKVGPALNGLKYRRERDWVVGHFGEPKKFTPGSTMPPYRMPEVDLKNLTDYLLALEPNE